MYASVSRRWVALLNPRCGSTSLRSMLKPAAEMTDQSLGLHTPHSPAYQARDLLAQRGVDWDGLFSFTTIRNPWARVASFWSFGAWDGRSVWRTRREAAGTFDNFCANLVGGLSLDDFVRDRNRGPVLVQAVVPIEDAAYRLPLYFKELGIDWTGLPHLNRSLSADYRTFYSEASYEAVSRYFASDIAFAGYTFDEVARPT